MRKMQEETKVVKRLIVQNMDEEMKVSKYFVIQEIKLFVHPTILYNLAIKEGVDTDDGLSNLNWGAKILFRNSIRAMCRDYKVDSEGWIRPLDTQSKSALLYNICTHTPQTREAILDQFSKKVNDDELAYSSYQSMVRACQVINRSVPVRENREDQIRYGYSILLTQSLGHLIRDGLVSKSGSKKSMKIWRTRPQVLILKPMEKTAHNLEPLILPTKKTAMQNPSPYPGVSWHVVHQRWQVRVNKEWVGYFDDREEAVRAAKNKEESQRTPVCTISSV